MQVSLIIPTYNRSNQLKHCLKALSRQEFKEQWEVIIVDDGGFMDLQHVLDEISRPPHISLIKQPNRGPAAARNFGATLAKGRYIAFLDDDCEPHKDWLKNLIVYADRGVMIGGKTVNSLKNNLFSESSQLLVSFLYKYFEGTPWYFFTSNNFLVDRETFLQLGGFDEGFKTSAGEDREFCVRWSHFGNDMRYRPEALIHHSHEMNLKSFWKLHFKYGRAALDFAHKIDEIGVKPLRPQFALYLELFSFFWKHGGCTFKVKSLLIILVCISQVATFCGLISNKW